MSVDLVNRARKALEGVTPGPWYQDENDIIDNFGGEVVEDAFQSRKTDLRFIAAARQLVPAMASRIEALEVAVSDAYNAGRRSALCELEPSDAQLFSGDRGFKHE